MTKTILGDVMDPARANALLIALGRAERITEGDTLAPFFHQLYFWEAQPPETLGPDGHPRVGGLIPDLGLPRRMWAGGRLVFHAPLRAGIGAQKRSTCKSATHKVGRTGPLGFVTLRHEIWQGDALCIIEEQDLVYREAARPSDAKPKVAVARTDATQQRPVQFSTTLLFRYSALTFNGHRIHYDQGYARDSEGYEGLVVHGPLLAQLLLLMASDQAAVGRFAFRSSAPLMDWETAVLCRNGADMWVSGPEGRTIMTAQVEHGTAGAG